MIYVIITNVLAVLLVLGVMILIHELGHFLAAKYFGIKVYVFSLGFGPRIWGFKRGDTDYRVSMFPLGGYVKMAGENAGDEVTGDVDEFVSKPRWQRFIVAVMGPAMNILMAIGLLAGLYMYNYQKPAYQEGPAFIGWVEAASPAAAAGFQPGDRIVRLEGTENPNWQDIEIIVASNPRMEMQTTVERNGQTMEVSLKLSTQGRAELGFAGWYPEMQAQLQAVEPGMPAAEVGLQAGDEIISINGEVIRFWPQITELIQENQGKEIEFGFRRQGEDLTAKLAPVNKSVQGEEARWLIGVAFQSEMIYRQLGFSEAIGQSLATNKKFAMLIFEFVGKIFRSEMSVKTLEGPIGIARLSGQAARQGIPELIGLMAAISLNLGIFNLFPIPVLDGGVILILMIEGLIRCDLSLKIKERITQVGFAFLMLLMVIVIYNDIVKSLPERFDKFLP